MFVHIPDHFSSKFKFVLKKHPAKAVDRSSIAMVMGGWLFGIMLLVLGVYELLIFLEMSKSNDGSFVIRELSALIIVFIALGLVICSTFSFIRYKKFYFDGKNFHVTYRPAVGVKYSFVEPLKNYTGVRLRVLFKQAGLFNKNRYIIDLYHNDINKVIPLYISTVNKDIRKIWEAYAKMFKMPALSVGDRGLVQRDWQDLNKSVKELAVAKKLPFISGGKMPAPSSINIKETKTETIVKANKMYWDVFSVLYILISVSSFFALVGYGVYLTANGVVDIYKPCLIGAFLVFMLFYFAIKLLYSYELNICYDKIVINKFLFNKHIDEKCIYNDTIKSVELSYNPTIARYDIAVVSDEDITYLKNRLPVADLLWLKDFILRKLIND